MSDHFPHPALGIDYGDARIGIAASDPVGIMARISAIIQQRQIKTIVIGLPCHLDGREGESALKARRFAEQLQALHPQIPLHFVDEAYSTVSAAAKLHEAGKNAKKQKSLIDQAAAVEILNTWMGT
ncbi:MAG: Holliday junction resolvase RuvX [Verrucomicrobia bacterium]|nr:MAG: Holliday junction resolvase RuvX [Verrucomicrobiota bacterium]